jgi:regulator of sigma E protease
MARPEGRPNGSRRRARPEHLHEKDSPTVLHAFPDLLRTGAAFVVVLGVLVFVHEFGHYIVARWCGVHVEVFSIGFGKSITEWTDSVGTKWKLAWLPLGGYVKLHGQEQPHDVSDEVRASWMPGKTFHDKKVLPRALVVAAGPVANFLLASVLFAGLFLSVGRPVTEPVIGEVLPGGAAAKAGLMAEDRIEAIGGQSIAKFEDIQRIVVARPGEKLTLTVLRDSKQIEVPIVTGSREVNGRTVGMLGISGNKVGYVPAGVLESLTGGFVQTWKVTGDTLSGIAQMINGSRGTEELGGPLRIAQLSGQVAKLGAASLISFIAVLSVNLGLINLFPIPVLDGGHLLFYLFEALRGKPLPRKAQEYGFRAGIAVLATLFLFATWNDLTSIGLFRWVASLIG